MAKGHFFFFFFFFFFFCIAHLEQHLFFIIDFFFVISFEVPVLSKNETGQSMQFNVGDE